MSKKMNKSDLPTALIVFLVWELVILLDPQFSLYSVVKMVESKSPHGDSDETPLDPSVELIAKLDDATKAYLIQCIMWLLDKEKLEIFLHCAKITCRGRDVIVVLKNEPHKEKEKKGAKDAPPPSMKGLVLLTNEFVGILLDLEAPFTITIMTLLSKLLTKVDDQGGVILGPNQISIREISVSLGSLLAFLRNSESDLDKIFPPGYYSDFPDEPIYVVHGKPNTYFNVKFEIHLTNFFIKHYPEYRHVLPSTTTIMSLKRILAAHHPLVTSNEVTIIDTFLNPPGPATDDAMTLGQLLQNPWGGGNFSYPTDATILFDYSTDPMRHDCLINAKEPRFMK